MNLFLSFGQRNRERDYARSVSLSKGQPKTVHVHIKLKSSETHYSSNIHIQQQKLKSS